MNTDVKMASGGLEYSTTPMIPKHMLFDIEKVRTD